MLRPLKRVSEGDRGKNDMQGTEREDSDTAGKEKQSRSLKKFFGWLTK